jgi:GNAT superfamily N-acetyltransferase
MPPYRWVHDAADLDWDELSELYRVAPLGTKPSDSLRLVFGNSRFVSLAYDGDGLVGAGRALADGLECAYIADVAVHPDHQGHGLGRAIIGDLVAQSAGHRRIILYANPGKEGFYAKLGFLPMNTAMAIWHDPASAVAAGILRPA